MEDTSKCADDAPKLLMLEEADLPLGVSMSMFMSEVFPTIRLTKVSLSVLGFNVFATSLMGTTMQDGGKRERSIFWANGS